MTQKAIGVGMIGCGTVGGGVARLLREEAELYRRRLGVPLELRRVLVRDPAKHRQNGDIPVDRWTDDADVFFASDDMPIMIEVAGGVGEVAQHVRRALSMGKHVVTANKSMLAQVGPEMFAQARAHQVSIAFEASCGGGIPIITALQFGLMANQIDALYGILNGTSNYILTAMTREGASYRDALQQAQEKGFAEADPTMDVSGRDAAQKLAILASIGFGLHVYGDQVICEGIDTLDLADIRFGAELGYDVKLLAIAQRVTMGDHMSTAISLRTQPCFIHADLPLAQVHGSFNALSVYGHAVGHTMYYGPGAGAMPTASAVVSDLLNVASGWYPQAFARLHLWPDRHGPAVPIDTDNLQSRYYLRINARDEPGVMAKVSVILGDAGISLSAIRQHEPAKERFVPLVITTHRTGQGGVHRALAKIEELDVIRGRPVCIRIVDMPGESSPL